MKNTTGNYKLEEKYTKAIISNRTEQKHTYKERDIYIFDKKYSCLYRCLTDQKNLNI